MKKLDKVKKGFLRFFSIFMLLIITGVALKEEDMIRKSDMIIIIVLFVVEIGCLCLLEKDKRDE